jgi:hypothetical protein
MIVSPGFLGGQGLVFVAFQVVKLPSLVGVTPFSMDT